MIPAQNPKSMNLNTVAAEQVVFRCYVREDGVLTASAHIGLALGSRSEAGVWEKTLVSQRGAHIAIPDVLNPPANLPDVSEEVQAVFAAIIGAVAKINAVKKLV